MSSSRFLTGSCEKKMSSRGKLGEKGCSLHYPQGKRPIIGRKLARSTVNRTTSIITAWLSWFRWFPSVIELSFVGLMKVPKIMKSIKLQLCPSSVRCWAMLFSLFMFIHRMLQFFSGLSHVGIIKIAVLNWTRLQVSTSKCGPSAILSPRSSNYWLGSSQACV